MKLMKYFTIFHVLFLGSLVSAAEFEELSDWSLARPLEDCAQGDGSVVSTLTLTGQRVQAAHNWTTVTSNPHQYQELILNAPILSLKKSEKSGTYGNFKAFPHLKVFKLLDCQIEKEGQFKPCLWEQFKGVPMLAEIILQLPEECVVTLSRSNFDEVTGEKFFKDNIEHQLHHKIILE